MTQVKNSAFENKEMMNNFMRLAVGILGSAFALLMYGAPITTFKRVIEKRTTESFSGLPYTIALFNCLLYTFYGSPLISNGWDNIVVMVVNGIGLLIECCFVCIYLIFAPPKPKKRMAGMVACALMLFGAIAIASFCAVSDHKHKKALVGTAGMVATVILYASPLSVIRMVIQTKSVEFMPSFYFSLFAFLGSVLWMVYGSLSKDIVIMAPNFVGVPLGLAQLVLYCFYRNKKSPRVEDAKLVDGGQPLELRKEKCEEKSEEDNEKCQSYEQDIEMQLKV